MATEPEKKRPARRAPPAKPKKDDGFVVRSDRWFRTTHSRAAAPGRLSHSAARPNETDDPQPSDSDKPPDEDLSRQELLLTSGFTTQSAGHSPASSFTIACAGSRAMSSRDCGPPPPCAPSG